MRISALIVDDELHNIENLCHLLHVHCPEVRIVGTATQVQEALTSIHLLKPDLLFLDIRLNKDTAFSLLQKITGKNISVIFITAYDEYGIQAIKYAALDYLLKPIDSEELIKAVQKATDTLLYKKQNEHLRFLVQELSSDNTKRIALPMLQETRYVEIKSIVRCEASNNYTNIFLDHGEKILIAKTLKEYAEILPASGFIRTHQSHLVNRIYIKSWQNKDGGMLLLTDGTAIPISRVNKERLKNLLRNNQF